MFSKRKINSQSQQPDPGRPQTLTHIDTPTAYPRATLFQVSGWVASDSNIDHVEVGGESMTRTERVDVKAVHPSYEHVMGFSGLARENEIDSHALCVTIQSGPDTQSFGHSLDQNVMLPLSKREKFSKFATLFPSDDTDALVKTSHDLEINNDDGHKHDALRSILKCPVCGEIGVQENESTLVCANNHAIETIDKAYIYLNAEMRQQHNIRNNIEPASRAQDPLAVALIGKYKEDLILDCGAGLPFQNYRNVVNFEIEKFANTDVIGVGEELPFADNSFAAVFSFSVLEHVKDPFQCAAEIQRVLKPGGILYCSVPFLIPVHGYPHHYYNMTQQGLSNLFDEKIEVLESGVPISGHPLFTLNSVANIWCNALSAEQQEAFKGLTLAEIMDDPAKLIANSYCSELPQEVQTLISCTNMILGKKIKST